MHSQIKCGGWGRIPWQIDSRRDMRRGGVSEGEIEGGVKFGGESLVLKKKEELERGRRRKTFEGVWKEG
jgi:hypothetical protein